MEIVNVDKSYDKHMPYIILRKGDSHQSSLRFQIMDKNIPFDISNYGVKFKGRDSVGNIITEDKVIVIDGKNGIIEVVMSKSSLPSLGEFQIAYLCIYAEDIEHSTTNINITILNGVE